MPVMFGGRLPADVSDLVASLEFAQGCSAKLEELLAADTHSRLAFSLPVHTVRSTHTTLSETVPSLLSSHLHDTKPR